MACAVALPARGAGAGAAAAAAAAAAARLLVVPFENAKGEPRLHWLGEAAAVLVTDGLRRPDRRRISRDERVRAFEQLHLPVDARSAARRSSRSGSCVGAAEVIVGAFRVEGDDAVGHAPAAFGSMSAGCSPRSTEQRPLTDLFAIFDRLAPGLRSGRRRRAPAVRPPLDAFENYIKGLIAESPVAQATFLEAALRDQPGFDRARLALWDVRTEQDDHAAALEAVRGGAGRRRRSQLQRALRRRVSLIELKRYDEAFTILKALLDERARRPGRRCRPQQPRRRGAAPRRRRRRPGARPTT